jgi:hypothetical protein
VRQETVCAAVMVGAAASEKRDGPRQRGSMHAVLPDVCRIHSTVNGISHGHLVLERIGLRRTPAVANWRRHVE